MLLRKGIIDSLSRQGKQNIRGPPKETAGKKGEKEQIFISDRAHKQVLTVKENIHLILYSNKRALVTRSNSAASKSGSRREDSIARVCMQMKPAQ